MSKLICVLASIVVLTSACVKENGEVYSHNYIGKSIFCKDEKFSIETDRGVVSLDVNNMANVSWDVQSVRDKILVKKMDIMMKNPGQNSIDNQMTICFLDNVYLPEVKN